MKVTRITLGGLPAGQVLRSSQGDRMGEQKSAEAVVVAETGATKGRTCHEWQVTRDLCASWAEVPAEAESLRSRLEGPEVRKVIEVSIGRQAIRRTKQARCCEVRVSYAADRNRRMRNRTYGGVGGGRRIPAPYPIAPTSSQRPVVIVRIKSMIDSFECHALGRRPEQADDGDAGDHRDGDEHGYRKYAAGVEEIADGEAREGGGEPAP
jgi:hypothetical protein